MDIEVLQAAIDKLHDTFDSTSLDVETKKMLEKLEEARFNPGAVKPIADCIFSLLLAARSRGYGVDAVMTALDGVAQHALDSNWKKMPNGTYQAT